MDNEAREASIINSRSSRSRGSSSSSLAKARAKTTAARAGIVFSQQQVILLKQQAVLKEQEALSVAMAERKRKEIEAELQLLNEQKLCAEAEAEANVLETISEWDGKSSRERKECISSEVESSMERTRKYVESHSLGEQATHTHVDGVQQTTSNSRLHSPQRSTCTLNPKAPAFLSTPNVTDEFTNFLLRQDLLLNRFSKFDDEPQNYAVWKAGFLGVIRDLGVGPRDELELLVKWLGEESVTCALGIRSANASNPEHGFLRVWERLDETFGALEMVEAALKRKLDNFPKLTNKDGKRLYEISDILSEIESTMETEQYQDLLSYFNTSSGMNPIVNKLPYNLQEKWTSCAIRYKKTYAVSFPPFSCFSNFIRDISKVKNDPGFMFDTFVPRQEKPVSTQAPQRKSRTKFTPMAALKTEVSAALGGNSGQTPTANSKRTESETSSTSQVKDNDFCHLHNVGGHTLGSCRSFRSKPLSVRKKFIGDKGICYKCCESTDHRASTCGNPVKCGVCGDARHPTALHLNGGDKSQFKDRPKTADISSACSRICGDSYRSKSCADSGQTSGERNNVRTH